MSGTRLLTFFALGILFVVYCVQCADHRAQKAQIALEDQRAETERAAGDARRAERRAERVAQVRAALLKSDKQVDFCTATLELKRLAAREALPELRNLMNRGDVHSSAHLCAAVALAELGDLDAALEFLAESSRSSDVEVRSMGLSGFGEIGPPAAPVALPVLQEVLSGAEISAHRSAVQCLRRLGPSAIPLLKQAAFDSDQNTRREANMALAELGEPCRLPRSLSARRHWRRRGHLAHRQPARLNPRRCRVGPHVCRSIKTALKVLFLCVC
jgi:HEAT repeat protein